jgi:thioredoxin reductase
VTADAFDVAVVGGGPAGLVCATTLAGLGAGVVLFEELALGGELGTLGELTDVPLQAKASGPDLAADLMEAAMAAEVVFRYETADGIGSDVDGWLVNGTPARALVLATGTEPDLAAVPGASALLGRGVSVCSSCDGPLFRDRPVAVLGSGRDAVRAVSELRPFAAAVTWITPEPAAQPHRDAALGADGAPVTTVEAATVVALDGDPLERVTLRRNGDAASESTLELAGLFVALPRRARHPGIPGLADGVVDVGPDGRIAGLRRAWAAGDVRSGSSTTIAGALGDATTVAWDVARELGLDGGHA